MSRFISYLNSCSCRLPSSKEGLKKESEKKETKLVCKYNVTSTSEPTALRTNFEQNIFKSMEVDGLMLDELVTEYTFDSTGVHTVKYELYDDTKLGNSAPAFYNNNLIEATIPSGVTSICNNVFNNCSGLTSVTIGNGVTSIGTAAFFGCTSLTSIVIPNSVTSIAGGAFTGCDSLTSVSIDSNAIVSSAYTSSTNMKNIFGLQITEYVIGNSVASIGQSTFQSSNALTSVTIGSGVTSIGDNAFNGCSGLTSVTVSAETPPTLGTSAFDDNASGRKIYVPAESVEAYKSAENWSTYADSIFPIE